MTTVQQVFTGDASQLQREYEKLARSVTTLEGKLGQTTVKSEQLGRKHKESLGSASGAAGKLADSIIQVGAAYMTADAAIKAFNYDLEISKRLGSEAAKTQSDIGKALAKLGMNVLDQKQFQQVVVPEVYRISKETGFADVGGLATAAGAAISASGGDTELGLDALRTAAKITKLTPESLQPMTEAVTDIRRFSEKRTTSDESAGLALSAGKFGRIVDPQQQASVLSKGIGSIVASSRGDKKDATEQAAEVIAALTLSMGDRMGDRSATAAISLSSQLDKLFTEGIDVSLGGRKFKKKMKSDPGNLVDRIEALREDEAMRKLFLQTAHFEAGADPVIRDLLTNKKGQAAQTLNQSRESVGFDAGIVKEVEAIIENGTPEIAAENRKNARAGRNTRNDLANKPGAATAELYDIRDADMYRYREYSSVPSWFKSFGDFAGDYGNIKGTYDPGKDVLSEIDDIIGNITHEKGWFGMRGRARDESTFTDKEKTDLEDLREMRREVVTMNEIRDGKNSPSSAVPGKSPDVVRAVEQQTQAVKEQTQAIHQQTEIIKQGQQQPPASPAPLIPSGAARGMIGAGRER